jgi:hypothetical protein
MRLFTGRVAIDCSRLFTVSLGRQTTRTDRFFVCRTQQKEESVMNRWPLFISCLYLITIDVFAQESPTESKAFWGIKGGLCFANQNYKYQYQLLMNGILDAIYISGPDSKYRTGLEVGPYAEIPIYRQWFTCLFEIDYIQKGMKNEETITDKTGPTPKGTWKDFYKVEYLSVPFLFKWRIPKGKLTPYAFIGPRFDIFLSSHVTTEIEASIPVKAPSSSYKGWYEGVTFNKIDFGGTVGLGVEASLTTNLSALLEVRYDHTFTNSFDNSIRTIRNRSFQILTGIRLPIKGIGVKVNAEKD